LLPVDYGAIVCVGQNEKDKKLFYFNVLRGYNNGFDSILFA